MPKELTAELLRDKLFRQAGKDSVIRLHFRIDAETHKPVEVTLQAQHVNGNVVDLWCFDGFEAREVDHPHAN